MVRRVGFFGACSSFVLLLPILAAAQAFMPAGTQFPIESAKAWGLIQSALADQRIKTKVKEKEAQVIVTRPLRTVDKNTNWLAQPQMPSGYLFESAEVHLFVSPFVEPARVYVGSVSTFKVLVTGGSATLYNDPTVNASVMAWVTRTLGKEAQPLPSVGSAGTAASACVASSSSPKEIVPP